MGIFSKLFGHSASVTAAAAGIGASIVVGCGEQPAAKVDVPPPLTPVAAAFAQMYEPDSTIEAFERPFKVRVVSLGYVDLPTGRIVACDPGFKSKLEPFVRTVSPGKYPVVLSILEANDRSYVAAAKIAFSDRPIVRWELATRPGQDPSTLKHREIFGYGVDNGTGAFMDASTFSAWNAIENSTLYAKFDDREWLNDWGGVIPVGEGNIIFCTSGAGDGSYASYWGIDADGNVAALLTDFYLIDWNK